MNHLASYARVNEFGFIETPYRKVLREVDNDPRFTEGEILRGEAAGFEDGAVITKDVALKLAKAKLEKITVKPRVTNEIVYLNSFREEKVNTAEATTPVDGKGYFTKEMVPARVLGKAGVCASKDIDYLDVSSSQVVSIATACIPFFGA